MRKTGKNGGELGEHVLGYDGVDYLRTYATPGTPVGEYEVEFVYDGDRRQTDRLADSPKADAQRTNQMAEINAATSRLRSQMALLNLMRALGNDPHSLVSAGG